MNDFTELWITFQKGFYDKLTKGKKHKHKYWHSPVIKKKKIKIDRKLYVKTYIENFGIKENISFNESYNDYKKNMNDPKIHKIKFSKELKKNGYKVLRIDNKYIISKNNGDIVEVKEYIENFGIEENILFNELYNVYQKNLDNPRISKIRFSKELKKYGYNIFKINNEHRVTKK